MMCYPDINRIKTIATFTPYAYFQCCHNSSVFQLFVIKIPKLVITCRIAVVNTL